MNKKGFTLTELLVAVVILGIVAGLSIPLLRNLSGVFEKKKYQNYADSVAVAAKLYTDSYSEDLFGHNEFGCAYITYDKLIERRLIKDIEIEDMSCNSDDTYVRVIKQKDKYGYKTFLACGKKTNGKIKKSNINLPTEIPEMNTEACTGTKTGNLSVTADMTQANGKGDKNRKKTKIIISSGTGIDSKMTVYAKWSQNANDQSNTGFEKIDFKVKTNQEADLLNGEIISTQSKELLTPKGNGDYYLIVRVDHLQDLYGNEWQNDQTANSKYKWFGPFTVDNTPPSITAKVYACDSNGKKAGSVKGTSSSINNTFNLSSITGNVSGWATSSTYEHGVCFGFEVSDNISIKSSKWEWNTSGKKANASGYQTLTGSSTDDFSSSTKTTTIDKSLTADGHRYGKITLKDYAGNTSYMIVDVKIDKTGPTQATINNPSSDEWKNTNITITISSSDALNSMGEYYSSLSSNNTGWQRMPEGSGKTSFTKTYSDSQQNLYYIKACDSLNNCTTGSRTWIRIDKTNPDKPTIMNPTNGEWTTNDVSLDISSSDTYSGIGEYYYTYNSNASAIGTNNASQWVKLVGGTDLVYFTTKPWTASVNNDFNKTIYVKVCDKASNCSETNNTIIKIDKTPPAVPTITNPTNGNWTTNDVILTLRSSDSGSGLGEYQYTYKSTASQTGTDPSSQWVRDGQATETYTANTISQEMNRQIYWRACDILGNCSSSSNTTIRIDKTPPSCGSINKTTTGTKDGVSGTISCSDSGSDCKQSSYSYSNLKETSYITIEDNLSHQTTCEIPISRQQEWYSYWETCWNYDSYYCGFTIAEAPYSGCDGRICSQCKQTNATAKECSVNYKGKWLSYYQSGNMLDYLSDRPTGLWLGDTHYDNPLTEGYDDLWYCSHWEKINSSTSQGVCWYDCDYTCTAKVFDIYCEKKYPDSCEIWDYYYIYY